MRFFDLFLRRSGVSRDRVYTIPTRTTSRFTIICSNKSISAVRKQICLNFSAVGLHITKFQIFPFKKRGFVSACITVTCPRQLRRELHFQTRILNENPAVDQVKFGSNLKL